MLTPPAELLLSYRIHLMMQLLRDDGGLLVKVFNFKPLVPNYCSLESCQGLYILSYDEAIQLVYRMFVVLLMCTLMAKIMQRGAP
jgi:hypothetical protein